MRISDFGTAALSLALVVVCSMAASAQGNTYTLDQVLAKMDEVGKAFLSMQATIERTKVTVIVNDKAIDSGTVYFTRRGKVPRIMLQITPLRPKNFVAGTPASKATMLAAPFA